jgi:asparagine synthase (glutamine-hydrolysing)
MCGIFFYNHYNNKISIDILKEIHLSIAKIAHRGPDNTQVISENGKIFGFHRLSINGLNTLSNQPFDIKDCKLICNGEIYNFRELIKEFNLESEYISSSDCEIIIHLYRKIGIIETLRRLDGVFAFVLYDYTNDTVIIGRDPFGVRSLFIGYNEVNNKISLTVGSEMKALLHCDSLFQFNGGSYGIYDIKNLRNEDILINMKPYYTYITNTNNYVYNTLSDNESNNENLICLRIKQLFENAVKKRLMSERPVGCLLSGGLDSSVVTAIVKANIPNGNLNTYSIGLKGSVDLLWARKVSEYLGTNHHEICLSETEFLSAINETIYQIESYCTTTVRASVGNYLVSKYINKVSNDVVIYCGDMSDEIFGSYRGFLKAPNDEDFKKENERMVRDVRFFDLLRSDKSISGAGLEARVPFADKEFLAYIMSLPPKYKRFNDEYIEKYIFRKSFDGILPNDILWRRKEAFSDGVSSHDRSWFQIIKEYIDLQVSDDEYSSNKNNFIHNPPYDKESYYYRKIFEQYYPGRSEVIPYYWRHPFCSDLDPSARLLNFYKKD